MFSSIFSRAIAELDQYDDLHCSVISWMEIMCKADTEAADLLLASLKRVDLNMNIARKAVSLRKSLKLKLPDATILATADEEGCILITRNTRDFKPSDPRVRMPYHP